ncbi:hypothetical protein BDFG_04914 [Blastomyces dermatitidis ATCC 26199]|nr:hypothetical protein BDFG_04914 [Blastomyces dermatitidis ATCC 26199]
MTVSHQSLSGKVVRECEGFCNLSLTIVAGQRRRATASQAGHKTNWTLDESNCAWTSRRTAGPAPPNKYRMRQVRILKLEAGVATKHASTESLSAQ